MAQRGSENNPVDWRPAGVEPAYGLGCIDACGAWPIEDQGGLILLMGLRVKAADGLVGMRR